jgi:hypothetical protein
MKDDKKNLALKHSLFSEKTGFEKFEEQLKTSIFGVLFVLLKNGESNFWMEMFSLSTELFQFMYYPFFSSVFYL